MTTFHRSGYSNLRVKILSLEDDKCIFRLENSSVSLANTLRRVMISEVPTLAIEHVEIIQNNTCLDDEFLSHRLGLIPLRSDKIEEVNYSEECNCDGWCEACGVELHLDVSQNQNETRIVTTSDIMSKSENFFPVDQPSSRMFDEEGSRGSQKKRDIDDPLAADGQQQESIVIVKLNRGQSLKCLCIAKKGVGKMHAKWSPVSTVTYQFQPSIELNDDIVRNRMTEEDRHQFVKSCPSNIYMNRKERIDIEEDNLGSCTYCKECVEKAEELGVSGLVHVSEKKGVEKGTFNFIFTVESTGAVKPEKILEMAVDVMINKLQKIDEGLSGLLLEDEYKSM